jgi:hypothetical protein
VRLAADYVGKQRTSGIGNEVLLAKARGTRDIHGETQHGAHAPERAEMFFRRNEKIERALPSAVARRLEIDILTDASQSEELAVAQCDLP